MVAQCGHLLQGRDRGNYVFAYYPTTLSSLSEPPFNVLYCQEQASA